MGSLGFIMNLFKAYFHYASSPVQTLKTVLAQRSFKQGCAGYFVAALAWVIFFNINDGIFFPLFVLKVLLVFLAEITVGYMMASLMGLFLDFSRTEASPAEMFVLIGASGFIKSLLIACVLISATFPWLNLGVFAPLLLLFVYLWQGIFIMRSMVKVYGISYGRSFCALLFAFLPAFVFIGLLFVFALWGLLLLF